MNFIPKSLIYVLFFLYAIPSSAGLIGDTITASGSGLGPGSATIGGGAEFDFVGLEFFDFDDSTLTITDSASSHSWGDFGFFTWSDFDDIITGFSFVSNSGYSGDPLSDFSFTEDSITLHWGVGASSPGAMMVFSIDTRPANQVPNPSALALFALGLAGLGWSRRKRA